jgi:lysophospholipase L1-like esterase
VGLDCYPSNPRGYFDLDLRDPATLARFSGARVRRVETCMEEAPYAVELRYNRLQFRSPEPRPRRAGVWRVAVLGDSFTEGQGVKQDDIYPRVLEQFLSAREPGGWEVLNFGRRGTDFPRLLENFEQLLTHDPDLVVYALMLNDPEQSEAFRARHAYVNERVMGRDRRAPEVKWGLFPLRLAAWIQHRWEELRQARATTQWYHELYGEPNREGWERTQADIRDMDRRVRSRGGRFLLVTWPVLADLDGDYPFQEIHDNITRFARAAGIAHLDLLPVLRGRSDASLWVHAVDRHPNEVAHRLAAASLAPVVHALARDGVTAERWSASMHEVVPEHEGVLQRWTSVQ